MQYNIFHNDFYEELPGLSWAYKLDVLLGESPEPILSLGKAVKEVDLPEAEIKVQQAFFSGLVFRIPIRYKNSGTFSITFNDNKRLDVYRDLMRLFRRSYDNREQNNVPASEEFREMYQTIGYDYKQRKYSDLSQELSFVIYEINPRKINYRDTQLISEVKGEELRIVGLETNDPEVVAKYTIRDCYIENIEEITFDYSSEECVEWSLKVHFNSFKVDYHNQDKIYMPEHLPDGFEMENLDMTGYLPDSESRYIAKFDPKRENDVDPDGKAARNRMTAAQAVSLAKKKLEQAKKDAESERSKAVAKGEKAADGSGQVEEGVWVTAKDQLEAELFDAETRAVARIEELWEQEGYWELKDEYGLDIRAMTPEEIDEAVEIITTERALQGKFDLPLWGTAADLKAKKAYIEEQEKKIRQSELTRADIESRNHDNIEFNMTESTNKFYDDRKDQTEKTAKLNQRAADIKDSEDILDDDDEIRDAAIESRKRTVRLQKIEELYRQGKVSKDTYKEAKQDADSYLESFVNIRNKKRAEQAEKGEKMKSREEQPIQRAQTYDEMPKEDK